MRSIATADAQILAASSAERGARVRVFVKDSGGTFRDLTTYPEEDFVEAVTWAEDVDSPGLTATITLRRAVGEKSLAPLHEYSPLNRGWNPLSAYAALLELGREVKIEAGVTADLESSPATWLEVFRGYVDAIDWASEGLRLDCSGLQAKPRDTWIEVERVYAHAQGASALKGCRPFELSRPYVLNELVLPSEAKLNGHFYKVTTAGTTSTTVEPAWPTGSGATVVSGSVTFTEVGATSITVGTAVETVMQQILDDNLGAGVVSLYTPSSPGWAIRGYLQKRESVWDAVSKLAEQIGWELRYLWDSGTSAFRLTFRDVNRSKTTPDATLSPSELVEVRQASKDISVIRNAVRVVYSNSANRTPGTNEPIRAVVEVSDATSISKYGRRFCEVAESSNSNIDTSTEATALANAVLADLKEPNFEWGVTLRFYPWLQLADLLRFEANGRHFSSPQDLALVSVSHSIEGGVGQTEVRTRGKPSTGHAKWLAREGRALPSDMHQLLPGNPGGSASVQSQDTVGGRRFIFTQDAENPSLPQYTELHVGESSGFAPSGSTLKSSGQHAEVTVTDLIPGKTYYAKVIPYRRNRTRLVRGLPSEEVSFVAGRTKAIHYDTAVLHNLLPLNGSFEHATRDLATNPPDHWEVDAATYAGETWGSSGSVYYGTDSDYGRVIVLREHASLRGAIISSAIPVRRGLAAWNLYISHRRRLSSGASLKDLIVDVKTYKDAALTTLVNNWSITISGDSSIYALNTWFTTKFPAQGTFGAGVNFVQLTIRRGTSGDSNLAYDVGDIYWQDAEFHGLKATSITNEFTGPTWQTPSFNTGWANYNTTTFHGAGYAKDALGFVHLRGMVTRSSGTGVIPFQLPAGHRPAKEMVFIAWGSDDGSGSPGEVEVVVQPDGDVWVADAGSYGYISLDDIRFDTQS